MPKVSGVGERFGAPALLAFVVTVGMGIIYWPLLNDPADRKFYGYGDSWKYYGPTQFYGDYVLHNGELPLWNPLILCGQPIAGNPQYANFYPPNVVRRVLTFSPTPFKTHVGLAFMLYAHVLSAALGTYALGRAFGLSRAGAFIAGVAFAFSAAFTQRIFGHLMVVMVVSWMPWCLCALRAVLRASALKEAVLPIVTLGVTFSMAILAGTPQMTLLVGFALVVYWVIERGIGAFESYARKSSKKTVTVNRIRLDLMAGGLAVALAAGFSAPLLVPALQFFADTPRGTLFGEGFEKTVGDETYSVPELFAAYGGGANYEGIKTLSAVGLIFVAVALFSPRRRETVLLGTLALLLIDASLERSFLTLRVLLAVSPFPISSPARGMMVAVLPLALLVGMGIDTLRDVARDRRRWIVGVAGAVGLVLCVLIVRRLADFAPAMSMLTLLYPVLAVICVWLGIIRGRSPWLPAVTIVLLVAEAVHWRGAYVRHLATLDGTFFVESSAQAPREFWNTLSRDVQKQPNRPLYDLIAQINGFDAMPLNGVISMMMPGEEGNRFWRAALPEWMAATGNRGYLLLKRGFWLHSHYVDGEMPAPEDDFPPTTTVFLSDPGALNVSRTRSTEVRPLPYSANVARIGAFPGPLTFTGEKHPTRQAPHLWSAQGALPPMHKVLVLEIQSDCRALLDVFQKTQDGVADILPLSRLYVEPTGNQQAVFNLPLPDNEQLKLALALEILGGKGTVSINRAQLLVDQADERERIHILSRSANAVEVEVRNLPAPRILSCIDFMYPGWHAYLDGKEVSILRAFSFFKAVEVPAGTHRVTFKYKPSVLYYGLVIWLFSLILCAALIRWARSDSPRN